MVKRVTKEYPMPGKGESLEGLNKDCLGSALFV